MAAGPRWIGADACGKLGAGAHEDRRGRPWTPLLFDIKEAAVGLDI
jgi:hypothetical protein